MIILIGKRSVLLAFLWRRHLELDLMSIECLGIAKPTRVLDKWSPPSLFQTMNRTKTACGAKLLKANLLQPLTHVPTLNCRFLSRLDCHRNDL